MQNNKKNMFCHVSNVITIIFFLGEVLQAVLVFIGQLTSLFCSGGRFQLSWWVARLPTMLLALFECEVIQMIRSVMNLVSSMLSYADFCK